MTTPSWDEREQLIGTDMLLASRFLRDWRESTTFSRLPQYLAILVLLVAVYFVAGKLGLRLAYLHPSATAVWAPTGIALAAFLLFGYRVWPAILISSFLVNFTTAGTVATSVGIAIGNTSEGLVGAYLVNRFAGGLRAFDRPQSIFRFAILAGVLGTAVSATFGVTSLSLGGFADWADFGSIWLTWWLGDAVGAVIFAPPLVLWFVRPLPRWNWHRLLEASVLAFSLSYVGLMVFGVIWRPEGSGYDLKFLCIPFLLWAAFRFGELEAATAVLVLSGVAIWSILQGPFLTNETLLVHQVFLGVVGVMATTVAAAVSERKRVLEALRKARDELVGKVEITGDALAEAVKQLAHSKTLLSRAQQIAHTGSFRWDAVTNRLTWSDELCRIYGFPPGKFAGTFESFLSCVHPDDQAEVRSVVERALQERQPFRMRERIVRPDGTVRFLDSAGEVVLNADDQVMEIYGVCRDITDENQAEQELQNLAGKLIHVQEEERARIGRELHDDISQRLGFLGIKLDQLRADATHSPSLERELASLWEQVNQLTEGVHSLSHDLHSSVLGQLGLVPALRSFVAEFSERQGIAVEFAVVSPPTQIPPDVALCFFRVVQESLSNIAKHSSARSAWVELVGSVDGIHLAIEDAGIGVDRKNFEEKAGLGFISIRERLRLVRGHLRITSSQSQGTLIEAWVPVNRLEARPSTGPLRSVP